MLCSDCGARSTLPTRCTNCGRPMAGAADSADASRPDPADEAAWSWAEDRGDVDWRSASDALHAEAAVKAARVGTHVQMPAQGWQLMQLKPVRGLAVWVYVTLGLAMATSLLSAVALFRRASLMADLDSGGLLAVSMDDVNSADRFVAIAGVASLAALIAAGVVFIVWLFRARKNIDLFGLYTPQLGVGWTIGSWFCPILNLWFGARVVDDVWKGSDASQGKNDSAAFIGRTKLIVAWWLPFVLSWVLSRIPLAMPGSGSAEDIRASDLVLAVSDLLMLAAGVGALLIVRRITAMQEERTAQLWAMSGPQATWALPPGAWGAPLNGWAPAAGHAPASGLEVAVPVGPAVPLAPPLAAAAAAEASGVAVISAPAVPAPPPGAEDAPAEPGPSEAKGEAGAEDVTGATGATGAEADTGDKPA
ncbi:DUF4328 domain-containing protein [Yinghuangia soli]|uniref:DUF4328 domain-containing protein n=1 Tax=Yinghuangia soli TaxID=2908204 RepID=A0AA41PZE9_9ACTN|nr:DUF4328 domain-containing protein [Yinghuangia soli]MCF2528412.1 DUF4328 domain-containing protein [Yinghuangia soli]